MLMKREPASQALWNPLRARGAPALRSGLMKIRHLESSSSLRKYRSLYYLALAGFLVAGECGGEGTPNPPPSSAAPTARASCPGKSWPRDAYPTSSERSSLPTRATPENELSTWRLH